MGQVQGWGTRARAFTNPAPLTTPCDYGVVIFERKGMGGAGRNGNDVGEAFWHITLALITTPPCDNGAVIFERKGVRICCINRDDVVKAPGDFFSP